MSNEKRRHGGNRAAQGLLVSVYSSKIFIQPISEPAQAEVTTKPVTVNTLSEAVPAVRLDVAVPS